MLRLALFIAAAQVVSGLVTTTGKCPSTTISYSDHTNAAGALQWTKADAVPDTCTPSGHNGITAFKICGPGTFSVSRMSCNNHEYKAVVWEHPKTSYTVDKCNVYQVAGTNVDGYLGSYSFSC
eukprot:NODE_6267_length_518_cov_377.302376.p2 GENE.NODE_6267_length_518_cov_377.302376~~NODE_6267_length_518_cov_377.302376.p2  ORF type:complete len:123 (+),score=26.77 NODE_6267_length_518_cov_377.302376:90-458(+)